MKASEVMTMGTAATSPEASLADAVRTMRSHRISGLPVLDSQGRLQGIISEGDFFRTDRGSRTAVSFIAERPGARTEFETIAVGQIMSRNPVTIDLDTSLEEAALIMERKGVKRLPVMDGDKVAGLITRADILGAIVG